MSPNNCMAWDPIPPDVPCSGKCEVSNGLTHQVSHGYINCVVLAGPIASNVPFFGGISRHPKVSLIRCPNICNWDPIAPVCPAQGGTGVSKGLTHQVSQEYVNLVVRPGPICPKCALLGGTRGFPRSHSRGMVEDV